MRLHSAKTDRHPNEDPLNARFLQVRRDTLAGVLMMLLGIGAAAAGLHYRIGSLSRMGPGFFPASVGVLLAVTGAAIVVFGAPEDRLPLPIAADETVEQLPSQWRGWILISLGIIAFIVLGNYG